MPGAESCTAPTAPTAPQWCSEVGIQPGGAKYDPSTDGQKAEQIIGDQGISYQNNSKCIKETF